MPVQLLEPALLAELQAQAASNPRGRQHHNLHAMDEPCHRLLVALTGDTYIAPHAHFSASKAETLLALRGRVGLTLWSADGQVQQRVLLSPEGTLGVDIPPEQFHSLIALDAQCLIFECKAGPYVPLAEHEFAHWAPREGEAGVGEFLAAERAAFAEVLDA